MGVTGVVGGAGSGSPRMKTGFLGSAGPEPAPSSSEEKANLGIVSKLMVPWTDGLGPRSGREEEEDWPEEAQVQDRSLLEGGATPQPH